MARLSPGGVLVIVIFFFIFVNPSAQPASIEQLDAVRDAVAKERANLAILNSSLIEDFFPSTPEESRWLNLTGLREGDGFKWNMLQRVRERARTQLEQAAGKDALNILEGTPNSSVPVFHNVSGWLLGDWVRSKVEEDLSTPNINLSAIAPDVTYYSLTYGRNITGSEGRVHMRINEKQRSVVEYDGVQGVTARLTLQDETSTGDGWTMSLHGLHHEESGSMLLTTTSEKFAGIFALPHLSISPTFFKLSQRFLNTSLAETIDRQEEDLNNASENPWTSSTVDEESPASPMCELVVYLQQHVLPSLSEQPRRNLASIGEIEQELRFPTGRPIPKIPQIRVSMLVFSPDCGFVLESKGPPDYHDVNHLEGPKVEVYVTKAKHIMLLLMLVVIGQLFLLVNQMKASITPSARSRISFYTLTMMSLGTGFAAFTFLFLMSFLVSMYLTAMTMAFLLFLEGNFFGMKFMMDIWTAQEPERTERQRRRQQRQAAATPAPRQNPVEPVPQPNDTTLPLPVTAIATPFAQAIPLTTTTPTPTTPDRPTTFAAIYTRYCLVLLSLIFISLHAATSWPISIRTFYTNTLTFLYLSFWTPQIHRNILRNCRKPFEFRFVIGQSVLRLAPFAYLWVVEGNVLMVDTDVWTFVGFVVWMVLQVGVLLGQEVLGPRWCVSEGWGWVPVAWDYHPILKEDEEGATLPIGLTANSSDDDNEENHSPSSPLLSSTSAARSSQPDETASRKPSDTRSFDCAICMQRREVSIVSTNAGVAGENSRGAGSASSSSSGLGGRFMLERRRREYMVTPCRHIFDTKCLEGWMGYRLQCPTCRETLPPL